LRSLLIVATPYYIFLNKPITSSNSCSNSRIAMSINSTIIPTHQPTCTHAHMTHTHTQTHTIAYLPHDDHVVGTKTSLCSTSLDFVNCSLHKQVKNLWLLISSHRQHESSVGKLAPMQLSLLDTPLHVTAYQIQNDIIMHIDRRGIGMKQCLYRFCNVGLLLVRWWVLRQRWHDFPRRASTSSERNILYNLETSACLTNQLTETIQRVATDQLTERIQHMEWGGYKQ